MKVRYEFKGWFAKRHDAWNVTPKDGLYEGHHCETGPAFVDSEDGRITYDLGGEEILELYGDTTHWKRLTNETKV